MFGSKWNFDCWDLEDGEREREVWALEDVSIEEKEEDFRRGKGHLGQGLRMLGTGGEGQGQKMQYSMRRRKEVGSQIARGCSLTKRNGVQSTESREQ